MTESHVEDINIKRFIGKVSEPIIMEVEKGAIKRYAEAVEDFNPLYFDEEYARFSRFGAIIAPPGFFGWPVKSGDPLRVFIIEVIDALAKAGYARTVDARVEFEFFIPIRAGDTLVAVSKIADIYEREGKTGKMIFFIREIAYTNQHGDFVAKMRQTFISR